MDKPTIILDTKPAKMIRWFTENWDKEIGALGVGRLDKGNIYVDKLVFPKQVVNGAHVHFTPEDWKPVMEELSVEELSNVIFYWHKHPNNCPGASSTDEEHTFEAFMAPEAKRRIFGFLQTALKDRTSGSIDYEARIAISKPIRVNTTEVSLVFMDENDIAEECQKIIKDKVTEGFKGHEDQPGAKQFTMPSTIQTPITNFSTRTIDNRFIPDNFGVEKKNGTIQLTYSPVYSQLLDVELESPEITSLCREFHHKIDENTGCYVTILQPYKKKLEDLFNVCMKISKYIDTMMDNEAKFVENAVEKEENKIRQTWYYGN
jgi:hypothetical protein